MIVVQGVFRVHEAEREGTSPSLPRRSASAAANRVVSNTCWRPIRSTPNAWCCRSVGFLAAEFDAHIQALVARRAAPAADDATPVAALSREIAFFEASPIDVM